MKSGFVHPRFFPAALFLIFTFFSFSLLAANRVVVLQSPAANGDRQDTSLWEKLVRELRASGFAADIIEDTPENSVEEIAGKEDASAAIRLNLRGMQVEVWVADRITGKTVARTIVLNPEGEPEDVIVVLAAVELLRASLMEMYSVTKPQSEVEVTRETRAFAKPAPDEDEERHMLVSGYLSVGVGASFVGADAKGGAHGMTALSLELNNMVQFSALGQFTFSPHTITAQEGTVDVYPFFFGAQSLVLLGNPDSRIRPLAGIGLGAVLFRAVAHKNNTYVSPAGEVNEHRLTVIVPTPFVKAGLRIRLTRFLCLRLESTLGLTTASTRIKMTDGTTAARIGRPWLLGDILLDITLW